MTPERWRQIEELYRAAQECAPIERADLLRNCDPGIRDQVERMLAQASGNQLLDRPAANLLETQTETVVGAGSRLGPYKIEAVLGSGGMGTVYRAVDTRLGRTVALKVTTARYSERFEREASAIATLNHPHICTLHDVGPSYLVMELLDGSTLAEEIKKGPLELRQAARLASEIADALAEAHAHGVVHRDLKPGNVMITRHGAKVLDFGLAKLVSEGRLTESNMIMGTPLYMAPEQMEGREADARTDLFALGLVLYEMTAGKLPYPGASLGSMLAAQTAVSIPPPCTSVSKAAARLNRLILRLLERDPAARPQSAADVRQELLGALEPPKRIRPALVAALAAVLALGAGALWWSHRTGTKTQRWPEVSSISMIPSYPGGVNTPAVSSDGTRMAFSSKGADGQRADIYLARLDGQQEPRRLSGDGVSADTFDTLPTWSRDGRQIAFLRSRGATAEIMLVPVEGGSERKLRDIRLVESACGCSGLTWSPDGSRIAFAAQSLETLRSTIFLMRVADGSVHSLLTPPDGVIGDGSPAFSADGQYLAFIRWAAPTTTKLLVQKLGPDGQAVGDPAAVWGTGGTVVGSPVWADSRRLLFADQQRIMEWESDATPQPIYVSGAKFISLSLAGRDGRGTPRLVAVQDNARLPSIWRIPLSAAGQATGPPVLMSGLGSDNENPDFSPDGKRIVFVRGIKSPELWTADAAGTNAKQLTHLGVKSLAVPRWSPDGRHVAFFARMPEEPQIYVVDTAQEQTVPWQATHEVPGCILPTWSRDGKYIYCSRRSGSEVRLFRVAVRPGAPGGAEMEQLVEGKEAREIPDGRILYIKDGEFGLFARSLSGNMRENPEQHLVEDIRGPLGYFAPVPEGVYYTGQDSLGRYVAIRFFDFARQSSMNVARGEITGKVNSLTVSPDGESLLYTQTSTAGTNSILIQFQ